MRIYNFNNVIQYDVDKILSIIPQEDIYSYYLNIPVIPDKLVKCCFHEDRTPSLGFYRSKSSKYLLYRCFGCGARGNVFEFIKQKFNLDYGQSVDKIRKDFNIGNQDSIYAANGGSSNKSNSFSNVHLFSGSSGKRIEIYPKFRNFRRLDFDYWDQYYIPLDLLIKYEVSPCSSVYIINKAGEYLQYAIHSNNNPIYSIVADRNSYTIYRPLNPTKKGKWLKNTNLFDIYGIKQLPEKGDLLFITSSLKDVLLLNVLGYNAIAPNSEGTIVPDKIMDYLHATWKEIILFYDNDSAGIMYSKRHSEYYNLNYILIPNEYKEKDISDFTKIYGLEESKVLLESLL